MPDCLSINFFPSVEKIFHISVKGNDLVWKLMLIKIYFMSQEKDAGRLFNESIDLSWKHETFLTLRLWHYIVKWLNKVKIYSV